LGRNQSRRQTCEAIADHTDAPHVMGEVERGHEALRRV
jgi:hypothetical protein